MKAKTRYFGEVDIEDSKVITLEKGMIGFPELNHFALIFDEEKDKKDVSIMWFQSLDDGDVAFPVLNPGYVMEDYSPTIVDEHRSFGTLTSDNMYILVTASVPQKIEDFSVNLKAPIIINTDIQKGEQIIVEDDYPIRYKVYELLKKKEGAGK